MTAHGVDPTDHGGPVAVTRSVSLDLDPDAAWRLIGTAEGLASWLGRDVAVDLVPGGALRLHDDDGTRRSGTVTDVRPGRSVSFQWTDGEIASDVTITVAPGAEGCSRVTVTETARVGGGVMACADAGAAWDDRLLALELGALIGTPAFAALA